MTTNWRERYNDFVKDVREYGDYPEVLATQVESFIQQTLIEELKGVAGKVEKLKLHEVAFNSEHLMWKKRINARLNDVQSIIKHKIEKV
jgi:hypothetical protein